MTANLTVRRPTNAEYDRIADLWFSSWLSTGLARTSSATRNELRLRLESEADWELYVAVKDEQIVGMLALKCNESKLDQLFVEPESQNQGIGRLLVNAAKVRLPQGIWLKVHRQNSIARRFYGSHGFEIDIDRSGKSVVSDDIFYRWNATT